MKKIINIAAVLLLLPMFSHAFTKIGGGNNSTLGTIANETGLAYSTSFDLSPDAFGAEKVAVTVAYTSATFATVAWSSNSHTAGGTTITATAHSLTTGLPILFRVTSGAAPGALTAETTYYAIPYDANTLQIATTSVKAQAGDPIILGAKGAAGVYSFIPLAISGTPSFKWQASNNGSDFFDLSVTSITMSAYVAGGTVSGWDFSEYNYAILRLNVVGPTTGGIYLKSWANLKE